MLFTFITTLIVYSIKKVHETYWCPSSIAYQEKKTDCVLKIFTFNDKNPLYLPIVSILHFFEGQSDLGVTQSVIKPFDMSQIIMNSEFKLKKYQVFPNPLSFFIYNFRHYLT